MAVMAKQRRQDVEAISTPPTSSVIGKAAIGTEPGKRVSASFSVAPSSQSGVATATSSVSAPS